MAKENIIACQISYLPLNSENYLKDIDEVIHLLLTDFPDCQVGEISTYFRGPADRVLNTVRKIIFKMDNKEKQYSIRIEYSNICGCQI
ncbi:MAG TPA: hypothetical protein DDX98_14465 [Bacteroidales bacterium]|jgi:uncharacterized protein YqgV (UPF0045/DUF77 family)|nr:hypothetical protein [Bacteroidales bacterium]